MKKIVIVFILNFILINLLQTYVNLTYAENRGTTYYISTIGTSKDGTDINNPMSLEIAKTKKYVSNDKILFKSGDTFYGQIAFNITAVNGSEVIISSYGEGELPIISGAKILNKESSWELYDKNNSIYQIDLTELNQFDGIRTNDPNSCNIGFLENDKGEKYYNREQTLEKLTDENDFYCDNKKYLYIKCKENPFVELGELKASTRIDLIKLISNIKVSNLKVCYTSSHGMSKKDTNIENVSIEYCIIENIGGSLIDIEKFTKYGNGIEFWNQGSNIVVRHNIFRKIYDAGFTIQGSSVITGFEKIECNNNIFDECTYPVEIFCRNDKKENIIIGLNNCNIYNNIIINQGRGWGYSARPDKVASSNFVIWNLDGKYVNLTIYNNIQYNSLKDIFVYSLDTKLKETFKQKVIVDYNKIFMNKDASLINKNGSYNDRNILKEYNAELNSQFSLIDMESKEYKEITEIAAESDDINEIRTTVLYDTGIYKKDGTISIKYVNSQDNTEIKKEKKITGLKLGTYGVVARDIEGYKVLGNNSCVLTLDEINNNLEIIFKYNPNNGVNDSSDISMWTNGMSSNSENDIRLISNENTELKVSNELKNQIEMMKNAKTENIESEGQDNTIINNILPNTGTKDIIRVVIIISALLGVYSGIKYYKFKKQTYKQI